MLELREEPQADARGRADGQAPCEARSPTRICCAKVKPDYTIGCKRITAVEQVVSRSKATQRRAGDLSEGVPETAVVDEDGVGARIDAIVFERSNT